jgi:CheY-like chemotaxis protein
LASDYQNTTPTTLVEPPKVFFIADDDLDDQELFIAALKEINSLCKCITATNGYEALKQLQEMKAPYPDFIFLDLNMPRLDGRQLLAAIKQMSELQDIPVIIYSTSADQRDIEETMQLGATHFLQKPNRFEDLRNALQDILSRNWK